MLFRLTVIVGLTIAFNCCQNKKKIDNLESYTNDTTKLLTILLDSAFYQKRIPDYSALTRNNPFGDTIVFVFDSLLVNHPPLQIPYKVLSKDTLCALALERGLRNQKLNNVLEIVHFEKDAVGYYVILQNQCVVPRRDNFKVMGPEKLVRSPNASNKCYFGFLCGGGLSLRLIRDRDGLRVTEMSFWSD